MKVFMENEKFVPPSDYVQTASGVWMPPAFRLECLSRWPVGLMPMGTVQAMDIPGSGYYAVTIITLLESSTLARNLGMRTVIVCKEQLFNHRHYAHVEGWPAGELAISLENPGPERELGDIDEDDSWDENRPGEWQEADGDDELWQLEHMPYDAEDFGDSQDDDEEEYSDGTNTSSEWNVHLRDSDSDTSEWMNELGGSNGR